MTLRTFLDLSTAHIHRVDMRRLTYLAEDMTTIFTSPTGLMVWTGLKDIPQVPERVREVLILSAPTADYVMFDRDAPIHPDYPLFEESWE